MHFVANINYIPAQITTTPHLNLEFTSMNRGLFSLPCSMKHEKRHHFFNYLFYRSFIFYTVHSLRSSWLCSVDETHTIIIESQSYRMVMTSTYFLSRIYGAFDRAKLLLEISLIHILWYLQVISFKYRSSFPFIARYRHLTVFQNTYTFYIMQFRIPEIVFCDTPTVSVNMNFIIVAFKHPIFSQNSNLDK